jgi:hypothetical protein
MNGKRDCSIWASKKIKLSWELLLYKKKGFESMKNDRYLREWTTITKTFQGNTTTTGYKESFEKLLDYHRKHLDSRVDKSTIKALQDYSFIYEEHCVTNQREFTRTLQVGIDRETDSDSAFWMIWFYIDGRQCDNAEGHGFENLLKSLGEMMLQLPSKNSAEYQEILMPNKNSLAENFKLYENLWD